jgi:hypothetical protein
MPADHRSDGRQGIDEVQPLPVDAHYLEIAHIRELMDAMAADVGRVLAGREVLTFFAANEAEAQRAREQFDPNIRVVVIGRIPPA